MTSARRRRVVPKPFTASRRASREACANRPAPARSLSGTAALEEAHPASAIDAAKAETPTALRRSETPGPSGRVWNTPPEPELEKSVFPFVRLTLAPVFSFLFALLTVLALGAVNVAHAPTATPAKPTLTASTSGKVAIALFWSLPTGIGKLTVIDGFDRHK